MQCRRVCAHPDNPTWCFSDRHIPSRASTSDSDRTRHTKGKDTPEKDEHKLRENGAAAAGIRPTHREVSNGQRRTKAEGVGDRKKSKVESKKVVVASGPDGGASKSRVDKPSKKKVVANGRETTGTKNVKTSSSKTAGNSTARSPKTPAKEKLKKKGLPSTKSGSASPNIDNAKENASAKSVFPLSTGAVGKDACPKPRTQYTAVGDIS